MVARATGSRRLAAGRALIGFGTSGGALIGRRTASGALIGRRAVSGALIGRPQSNNCRHKPDSAIVDQVAHARWASQNWGGCL